MKFTCNKSKLVGSIPVPGSKSHTIRGVLLASIAAETSKLFNPLMSSDTEAVIDVYKKLGAEFELTEKCWTIKGFGNTMLVPDSVLDVKNSGTTMRVALGTCSLLTNGEVILTGDEQIQKRPCGPLVKSLNDLGANIDSHHNYGYAPFTVNGKLKGGYSKIEAKTSQYLTSLLLASPLAENDTHLDVTLLYEKPYVKMTLDWLQTLGIKVENNSFTHFFIPGSQDIPSFTKTIPADFSSATFFLVGGALNDNSITCTGLDINDSQSDKLVIDFLREMGASIHVGEHSITVKGSDLTGIDIDMNDCPDALPMMAVAGCFAKGTTRLLNVPHARIKETDRIAVMATELTKLGAKIEELPDGLVIHQSKLRGANVSGHGDHRVVMALSVCGSAITGETIIDTAEAAAVTFPQFFNYFVSIGGDIRLSR